MDHNNYHGQILTNEYLCRLEEVFYLGMQHLENEDAKEMEHLKDEDFKTVTQLELYLEEPLALQDLVEARRLIDYETLASLISETEHWKDEDSKNLRRDDETLTSFPGGLSRLISGLYRVGPRNTKDLVRLKMEHCALNGRRSQWSLEVKCRKELPNRTKETANEQWVSIRSVFSEAYEMWKHNYVEVTVNSPEEKYELAVFGTPQTDDRKRMQIGIFGEKPKQGRDWKIWTRIFDDTMMAFEHVCKMEESRGHQLLTALAGLFVSNCDEDIKVELSALEAGWEIKGSKLTTISSKGAWNSPENSTDFPRCYFEISHVDKTKQAFFCGIKASHLKDTAETDVVAFYLEEAEVATLDHNSMVPRELNIGLENVTRVSLLFQIFVFLVLSTVPSPGGEKGDDDIAQRAICNMNDGFL